MEIFGRANAAAFDRYGWMYYSRDVFDFYGPFYWDSWPSLTGAIGMTYETDCGGWKGSSGAARTARCCSFRDGIAKHFVTAMATIEATGARRARARARLACVPPRGRSTAGRTGDDEARGARARPRSRARRRARRDAAPRSGIEVRRVERRRSRPRAPTRTADDARQRAPVRGRRVRDRSRAAAGTRRARGARARAALDTAFARTQIEQFARNLRRGANVPRRGLRVLRRHRVVAAGHVRRRGVLDGRRARPAAARRSLRTPARARIRRRSAAGGVAAASSAAPRESAYVFSPRAQRRAAARVPADGERLSASAISSAPIEAGGRQLPARHLHRARRRATTATLHARIDASRARAGVEVYRRRTPRSPRRGAVRHRLRVDARICGAPTSRSSATRGSSQTSYGAVVVRARAALRHPVHAGVGAVARVGDLSAVQRDHHPGRIVGRAQPAARQGRRGRAAELGARRRHADHVGRRAAWAAQRERRTSPAPRVGAAPTPSPDSAGAEARHRRGSDATARAADATRGPARGHQSLGHDRQARRRCPASTSTWCSTARTGSPRLR